MAKYCSVTDISNELNGLSITSSSTPSSATVDDWIEQESEFLELETGRMWGSETVTDEYHDYDGSGYLKTDKAPIITVSSMSWDENGIDATTSSWVDLTEGRTSDKDFIIYKDEGEIQFHGTSKPSFGYQNIKLTYTAGYSTVNVAAKAIVAKRVALRVIGTVVNGQTSEEGGSITVDVISLSDPSSFSLDRVKSLQSEIQTLVGSLGSFRTFRYNRNFI